MKKCVFGVRSALFKGVWQKHSEVRRLLHIAAMYKFRKNSVIWGA